MLTKCICTYCAGHLEFEEENAGEKIKCPHCGFETTLFLPGEEPEMEESLKESGRLARLKLPLIVTGAALLVLVGLGYCLNRWVLPPLKLWLPYTESPVLPIMILVAGFLGLLLLIAWIVFPALMFLEMRKLTTAVQAIEANGRPVLPVGPMAVEEEGVQEEADEDSAEDEQLTPAE